MPISNHVKFEKSTAKPGDPQPEPAAQEPQPVVPEKKKGSALANFRSMFKKNLNQEKKLAAQAKAQSAKHSKDELKEKKQDRALDFQRAFSDNEELINDDISIDQQQND